MNMMVLPARRHMAVASSTTFSTTAIALGAVLVELAALALPGVMAYIAYVGWPANVSAHAIALALFAGGTVAIVGTLDGYSSETLRAPGRVIPRLLMAAVILFFALVTVGFGLKVSDQMSRLWVFLSVTSGLTLAVGARVASAKILDARARAGRLTRNIAVIGNTEQARRLLQRMSLLNEPWNRVIGVFDDRQDRVGPMVFGHPVVGRVCDLVALARDTRVDDVIIALPWSADARIQEIAEQLHELPVGIRLAPDLAGIGHKEARLGTIGGVPTLDLARNPSDGWQIIAKRGLDKLAALALIIVLAPVMALIAAAVAMESPGPALYRQVRYGFNNKPFTVLKFRSMRNDARESTQQATADDPRVTRLGKLLRRTSLDELPQLFNVLGGSMSLVGPRPHAVSHNELYEQLITGYSARHRVRPGMTGWAQVNGLRGETSTADKMRQRVAYDIYYIENWSLLLDLRILCQTTVVGFLHRNAY